ncbi:DUF4142 domain-containing protein [Pseudonocardia nigra]|uniref:DUF4142 domain-containing protein n=1 Tax=Pseudonocardia nigra TaxID=1921578 RepID=UPI001C600B92|nr:DUF4142 domain-containing protein [Pseudonocardia nigra]
MSARSIWRHAVGALACLAIVAVASCSATDPAAESQGAPPAAAPTEPDGDGASGDVQRSALGRANQGALTLVALGGLGREQAAGDEVRDLGTRLATEGQAFLDRLQQAATAQGVALGDFPSAEQQALLADLRARSGQPFDQAWLRTAMQVQQQARDAATAILSSADASAEARDAAESLLALLDGMNAEIRRAATSAGADTPAAVDAGTGGQAATDAPPGVALGLLAAGVVLVCSALWRRRAT